MSDSNLIEISGDIDQWRYPYKMKFSSSAFKEICLAEVVNGNLDFIVDDRNHNELWKCEIAKSVGWRYIFRSPQFYAFDNLGERKIIFTKKGFFKVLIDCRDFDMKSGALSFSKKQQKSLFLNLSLEMNRKTLRATADHKKAPLGFFATILYFVWVRYAKTQENW